MLGRLIANQFRKPSGWLGRLVGRGMARSNEREARWTVDLLQLEPNSRALEIGFGPGVAIAYAAWLAPKGYIAGIDASPVMVQMARKRNAAALKNGQVELELGDVRSLQFEDDSFECAWAIHSIYFWPDPTACLRELRRVLAPGGLLAITILPKDKWGSRKPPAEVFTLYSGSEVAQLVDGAGFQEARIETYPQPEQFPGLCILARK